MFVHAGLIFSKTPTYIVMAEKDTTSGREYELSYVTIGEKKALDTFTFSHSAVKTIEPAQDSTPVDGKKGQNPVIVPVRDTKGSETSSGIKLQEVPSEMVITITSNIPERLDDEKVTSYQKDNFKIDVEPKEVEGYKFVGWTADKSIRKENSGVTMREDANGNPVASSFLNNDIIKEGTLIESLETRTTKTEAVENTIAFYFTDNTILTANYEKDNANSGDLEEGTEKVIKATFKTNVPGYEDTYEEGNPPHLNLDKAPIEIEGYTFSHWTADKLVKRGYSNVFTHYEEHTATGFMEYEEFEPGMIIPSLERTLEEEQTDAHKHTITSSITIEEDTVFTAHYTKIAASNYQIAFTSNIPDKVKDSSIRIEHSREAVVKEPEEVSGYTFKHWTADKDIFMCKSGESDPSDPHNDPNLGGAGWAVSERIRAGMPIAKLDRNDHYETGYDGNKYRAESTWFEAEEGTTFTAHYEKNEDETGSKDTESENQPDNQENQPGKEDESKKDDSSKSNDEKKNEISGEQENTKDTKKENTENGSKKASNKTPSKVSASGSKASSKGSSPKTGDDTNILPYGIGIGVGAGILGFILAKRKKDSN